MTSEQWKLEKDLCRCCHTEGSFVNLAEPCKNSVLQEAYSDMLKNCFDIDIVPVPGMLSAVTYAICELCIVRLRDASTFKKQVETCEQLFKDMINTNVIKAASATVEIDIKEEIPDMDDDAFKEVCSNDDSDDGLQEYDEAFFDANIIENVNKPKKEEGVRKKRKLKTKKTDKKSCRKVVARKNVKQETGEEGVERENGAEGEEGEEGENNGEKKKGPTYYTVTRNEYRCKICSKVYASQPLVSQHYRFVHLKRRPKDRKCPKCDERIPGHLRASHLEKEHGIPAPTCGVCGKKFRFPCNVIEHQKKVHMGEKTVTCDVCQKCFFNKLSLRLHMASHSGEKRFRCGICDKQFRWENNLKDHVRIHTGEKRFVCRVCEKSFVQKSTLKQHAARNHPGVDVL